MVDGRVRSGKASAEKMTAEQRKERALKGVEARKERSKLPSAEYEGKLNVGEIQLSVAVLDNEQRVITQQAVFDALDRPSRGNARQINTPVFMDAKNLQPYISQGLREVIDRIEYIDKNGKIQKGYDANILPLVADLYLKAREAKVLHPTQIDTAKKAEVLVRAFALVGIRALVDEATGYQAVREKDDLAKIFEAFVAKELQPWIKTFPDDYYKELFRLYELPQPEEGNMSKPQFFGKVTNKVIYKKLAPKVLPELKKQAAKLGKKSTRLHQALTPEKGHPDLLRLVSSVTTIAKLSKDKNDFFEKVDIIHPDFDENYVLEI